MFCTNFSLSFFVFCFLFHFILVVDSFLIKLINKLTSDLGNVQLSTPYSSKVIQMSVFVRHFDGLVVYSKNYAHNCFFANVIIKFCFLYRNSNYLCDKNDWGVHQSWSKNNNRFLIDAVCSWIGKKWVLQSIEKLKLERVSAVKLYALTVLQKTLFMILVDFPQ